MKIRFAMEVRRGQYCAVLVQVDMFWISCLYPNMSGHYYAVPDYVDMF